MNPPFHVVLVHPQIPGNTGSVGRLCVGTGARLHLVEPLGFDIDDKAVRRAGLDYWGDLDLTVWPDWCICHEALLEQGRRFHFLSSHAGRSYTEVRYRTGDVLVFGKEESGFDDTLRAEAAGRTLAIPRLGPVRSFNLATAVGIVLFEGLRQVSPSHFPGPE